MRWSDNRVAVAMITAIAIMTLIAVLVIGNGHSEVRFGNDRRPISGSHRVGADKRIARSIFGNVCGGHVAVSFAALDGDIAGQSSWTTTEGSDHFTDCSVIVDNGQKWSDETLCGIIVHEYGHLAGLDHSSNRRSVMYPRLSDENIPSRCRS